MWLKHFEYSRVGGRRSGYAEEPVGMLLAQTLNESLQPPSKVTEKKKVRWSGERVVL